MRQLMIAVVFALAAIGAQAQAPAPPADGPAPTGLVVGSGNFFSPIVSDLDKAIAFYRDGLGLDVQGPPANADANPALRNMFGLPDAQLRWSIGRAPGIRGGVEIVEIKKAEGKSIERRIQDSGAFTLLVFVRNLDEVFARAKQAGAPVVTTGGAPVAISVGAGKARAVVVKDPDGHFVEIVQPEPLPETASGTSNVFAVRVRLTVDDVDKAGGLYRDVLALQPRTPGEFRSDAAVMDMLGLKGGQYRVSTFQVPTSGLTFELVDFKGVDRRTVRGSIQDPGSTRIQLQVRDVDATITALTRAGGAVVSTGGSSVDLPGRGGATTKVAIVRDPNNLFLVLLQAAPPRNP
jgi:catechol 2,3-dioxygenase-like lactoylglutathione lyase family enzyme